ncbi:Fic family protein [Pseudomonas cichorii]|nr:Fic family protein [Pseudomonas cichorii]MBX8533148.1 Fic family protein [Pseudomonas cichorii]MBX8543071.1 Fic family protein [Pseudomonas cichorii]MBX8551474.1 Fic family protein [Pseudomonas cichorii]MBX8560126.1 Fic family protein [Pseudomonas cichorii]MBX8586691.1 Fic family protein [Pseudomonas cichorii]
MIKLPPKVNLDPFKEIIEHHQQHLAAYIEMNQALDAKGRYLHYDKLRFRIPAGLDHGLAWSVVKLARSRQLTPLLKLGEPAQVCNCLYTPAMHLAVSACDQHTTTAALEWMCSRIGESKHLQYLLKDLIEDEAISSSQLEGAATTTKAAKELLKRKRAPRTPDEKMIIGNFRMMNHAWEYRDKALSLDLITGLHQVGVEGIDDDRYHPGEFRHDNDVVVEDGNGDVVHQPPPAETLEKRLNLVIDWVNTNHTDINSKNYIHPLIKAIVIHFIVGFEHPFHDGNGRVARSLFYWHLFKSGFGGFRYIAISTLLKAAPIQYGQSYLYTETDHMDLTYFIDYQCRVIARAISEFKSSYDSTVESINQFNNFLYESGLYGKLSDKQRVVFNVAKSGSNQEFTVTNVKENLGCAYNTAATVLNGLVELKLFTKRKQGNEWTYAMNDARKILKSWKA